MINQFDAPLPKCYVPILGLYWIASATWFAAIVSFSAKSAILLASFNTR